METISLSINPTYYCNFRCNFCYLSAEQLGSSKRIAPDVLYQKLLEVSLHRNIQHIDLYGGEVGILPQSYLQELHEVIRFFYSEPISVISNLKFINPYFQTSEIDLSVSWDYIARESHETVYENMKQLKRPFHVLILASHELVNLGDSELKRMWNKLNALSNLQTVEIKPYSKNLAHTQDVSYSNYETFVKKWVEQATSFNFEFINIKKIEQCLSKSISSWSDDHLYITPEGRFAVLEFDKDHNEFFMPLDTVENYFDWTQKEKIKISANKFCSGCDYLGHCLSEHLQEVKDLNGSCNGFKNLLDWYKSERPQI